MSRSWLASVTTGRIAHPSGAERRARQAEIEAEFEHDMNERPNISPTVKVKCCPANLGFDHDYTMHGVDGNWRCWFCCARKPEATL